MGQVRDGSATTTQVEAMSGDWTGPKAKALVAEILHAAGVNG